MDNSGKIRVKKGDIWILFFGMFLAGVVFLMTKSQKAGEYVHITENGKVTTYPLDEDKKISLKFSDTAFNTILIKDHVVSMENASCPDQICVRHKGISKNGESIICLPNEVYIEVESRKEKEIDN